MAIEFKEPAWPPRIDGEPRLNPIVPLVDELHTAVKAGDEVLIRERLVKLGNALIPHAQNHDDAISMLDFVQIGMDVRLKKHQFWCFDIESGYSKYQVQRTDVWNGSGVSLQINKYEMDEFCLGVCLQKKGLEGYSLSMGTTLKGDKYHRYVVNDIVLERSVFRGARSWK